MAASLKERQRFKAAGAQLEQISKQCKAVPKLCEF